MRILLWVAALLTLVFAQPRPERLPSVPEVMCSKRVPMHAASASDCVHVCAAYGLSSQVTHQHPPTQRFETFVAFGDPLQVLVLADGSDIATASSSRPGSKLLGLRLLLLRGLDAAATAAAVAADGDGSNTMDSTLGGG